MKKTSKFLSLCLTMVMFVLSLPAHAESVTVTNAANYEYATMTKWVSCSFNKRTVGANLSGGIRAYQKDVAFAYFDMAEIMKSNPESIVFKMVAYGSGTANVYKVDINESVLEALNSTSNQKNTFYFADTTSANYTEEAADLFAKYKNIYNNQAQYTAIKENLEFVTGKEVEGIELKNLADENGRVLIMFTDADPTNQIIFGFQAGDSSYVEVRYAEDGKPAAAYDASGLMAHYVDTDMIWLSCASTASANTNNKIGKNVYDFSINKNNNRNGFIQADLSELAAKKDYVKKVYLKMTVDAVGTNLLKLKKATWRDISQYADNAYYVYNDTNPTLSKEEFLSWVEMMNSVGKDIAIFNCPTTSGESFYVDVTDYALSCIEGDGKISTAVSFFRDQTTTSLGTKPKNTPPQFIVYVDDAAINAEKERKYLWRINAVSTVEEMKSLIESEITDMGGELINIKNHDRVYEAMTGIQYDSLAQFIGKYTELCNAYIKPVVAGHSYVAYSNRDNNKVSAQQDNLDFYTGSRELPLTGTRNAVFVYDISEIDASDIYKVEYQHNGLDNTVPGSTEKADARIYTVADSEPMTLYTYEDSTGKQQTQMHYGAENDSAIVNRTDKDKIVKWYNAFVDKYINSEHFVSADYAADITNDFVKAITDGMKSYTVVLKKNSKNVKFYTESTYKGAEVNPVQLVVYIDTSDKPEENVRPYEIVSINDCNDLTGTVVSGNKPFYYCGSVTLKKNTDEYNNPTIIIAAYRNGKLENVMSKTVNLSSAANGANTDVNFDAEMRAVGYWEACPDMIKAFVVDGFTAFKPISEALAKNHDEVPHYNGSHE